LHALINNAAQTLTDSVREEERAIEHEKGLARCEAHQGCLIEGSYKARVRGGALPLTLESGRVYSTLIDDPEAHVDAVWPGVEGSKGATTEIEPYTKSSWVQGMSEIPYQDVGSALSVNTFVPFILCRELLPLMGTSGPLPGTTVQPQGYVINVSSREGIFEDGVTSSAKRGKHVHTNMSKAALNMLTETEAEPAWRTRRVAMNTVDPGYMSAAPEYEDAFEGTRPIGWEDGAGRVLWPIAVAEVEGQIIRGRFLKHYGAVEVDPGRGRG
jgi:NAD(P)-dependent dehydrogenase (short-subunit alcohol dehydrogenase family)